MGIAFLLVLLALAAVLLRRRVRRLRAPGIAAPLLTDDLVRQIEEAGWIDLDEPLDLEQIQEEEARFWEEQPWEEPDEF